MLFMATEDHKNGWLLDSGASSHMTPFRDDYISYRNISNPIAVTIADGACLNAFSVADVKMVTIDGREITVTEVLFIPNLDRRLISIPKLTSCGLGVMFGHRSCDIMKNDKLWVRVPRHGDSYHLCIVPTSLNTPAARVSGSFGMLGSGTHTWPTTAASN
ncbi:hypothetical protein PsorP6_013129 [Peronosclerospora sorghi]|uniref:Uncharacterized protein n=1 Tax=Peronosclerospora sorghi TaxID=230839 RepID=A0ACC0WFW5_9STRA|nr:hypothetical protein PsorP6_013129 [Peronosclerospora sorghi]